MRKQVGITIAVCSALVLIITGISVYFIIRNNETVSVENTTEPVTESTIVESTTLQDIITETVTNPTSVITVNQNINTTAIQSTTAKKVTTSAVITTGFFDVVTSGGTVGSDDSLSGLSGEALTLGKIILAAGFRYDPTQKIFYSNTQSWQRNFGYTPIYDVGATLGGMYYDTIRLKFTYGDYDYMYQIWKGRYGITTGGEMGVYYKKKGASEIMYACVPDSEMITMSFALYRNNEVYMLRGPEKHWWLTGFKIFDVASPSELTMHCTFFMDETDKADELEKAIIDYGFTKNVNYQRVQNRITVVWN